jgi:hypothetical protein
MKIEDFLQMVEDDDMKLLDTLSAKGDDYAGDENALRCFETTAAMCDMLNIDAKTPHGVAMILEIVKITRMCTLMFEERNPKNEALTDSFADAHGYLHLAKACFINEQEIGNESAGYTVTFTYPVGW